MRVSPVKLLLISLVGMFAIDGVATLMSHAAAVECIEPEATASDLSAQIRSAGLVFTGKVVSDITADKGLPYFRVKVKRLLIGHMAANLLVVRPVNIGDSRACSEKLRHRDSAIFVATTLENAVQAHVNEIQADVQLVLHPIKMTLHNLETFNLLVKDLNQKTKPILLRGDPCAKFYCAWGAVCGVGKDGRPHCLCPETCPVRRRSRSRSQSESGWIEHGDATTVTPARPMNDSNPISSGNATTNPASGVATLRGTEVCATDGLTYASVCLMRQSSCRRRANTRVRHPGSCAITPELSDPCRGKACGFGSQCVVAADGRSATCQCPDSCPNYGDHIASRPVCGSNGHDYKDKCELHKHACHTNSNITVKFEGKCDPCAEISCAEPEVCQLDHLRNPVCRCGDTCSLEFTPVCGSDGKTYSNECTLRQEACRTRRSLRIIYRRKCSSGVNPCVSVRCSLGEECAINKYGIARCECPPDCEPIMRPVCSKDERTFSSVCELRRAACNSRTKIEVAYAGMCDKMGPCSEHTCQWGGQCVEVGGAAQCECPSCSTEFQPVCGSDGISYSNECKLRLEACNHRRDVRVLYDGPCNGCENKKCEFYSACESDGLSEAQCVCPGPCADQEKVSVCGTNGVTYDNECSLKEAACRDRQYIMVAYKGHCDMCKDVDCKFGEHCKAGECVCPTDCSGSGMEPVCASNMVTYTNECELKKVSCLLPVIAQPLNVIFYGDCRERFAVMPDPIALSTLAPNARSAVKSLSPIDDVSNGLQETNKREACRDIHCDFEATCELGPDNFPRCTCKFDCTSPTVLGNSKPVCASDIRTYPSLCAMKMEACQRQEELRLRPLDLCQGMEVKPCNGEKPLVDPLTDRDLDCGNGPNRQDCPSDSYCHQTTRFAKCCRKTPSIYPKSCEDSWFGCCPDGKTPAQGVDHAGCPSQCSCHRLGSFGDTCDPETGQCHCRPGVGGLKCDRCEPGYWGLPKISSGHHGCLPCGCSMFGSVRDDCEQMTGRCVCKPDIQGQKCTVCTSHDKVLGPNGCMAVDRTTPPPSTCNELNCHFGAICTDRRGLAICECHSECDNETPGSQQILCGSDGQTYESECQLRLVACRHQKDIVVYAFGPCTEEMFPGTEWPVGRYTPMQFTQPDESHYPLSKSTRHLLTPDSRYYYSRHSPSTGHWDSPPGHNIITGINLNAHAAYRPTPATVRVLTALLGDLCSNDTDCFIKNSVCIGGACTCSAGFVETADRQECLANSIPMTTTEEFRACISSPCRGDGTCIDLPSSTFTCVCGANFTGALCDQEINMKYFEVPSFEGFSYIRLKTIKAYHKLNIEIEFKSFVDDAVILYNQQKVDGSGDFVSLALVNGLVQFRYNLGNGVVKITSLKKVEKGTFHHIVLKTYHRDGMLKLDDSEEVAGHSNGKLRALDLKNDAFLGFVPLNHSRIFENIGTNKGLVGCIKKLKINHRIIELHPVKDEYVVSTTRITECGDSACQHVPCKNGGTCRTIAADQYHCTCGQYFTGLKCELPVDPCTTNPCQNGGTCDIRPDGGFYCKCLPGRTGHLCRTVEYDTDKSAVSIPEFNGTSYIEYAKLEGIRRALSIEIWMLTYNANGMILYTGQHKKGNGDFVSISVVNRHIQLRFNLGSGICNITSQERVNLFQWHRIKIHRFNREASLQLDNGTSVKGFSGPTLTELNLELPLYIGAVPNFSEVHRLSGIGKGFHGAIQRIIINGKELKLLQTKYKCKRISKHINATGSFCKSINVAEYEGPPCLTSQYPCKNDGICIPLLSDSICQCKNNHSGRYCEIGPDIIKKAIKFTGHTFLHYRGRRPRKKVERGNKFELKIRTFHSDGLVLWRSRNRSPYNYLAIAIVEGYPEFSFNLGKQMEFWAIRFPRRINDGAWHTLTVRRQKRVGHISVDGQTPQRGISWPGAILFSASSKIWLGGASNLPLGLPPSYHQGFRGCIQSVKVNNKYLDLTKNSNSPLQYCHENEV